VIERITKVDNLRLDHFAQQIVAFARALADAREHREARPRLRDVVDELHHNDRLADARAAEQTDLAAAQKRLNQVDDFDSRFEHLELG
jgi:hypothetical protein